MATSSANQSHPSIHLSSYNFFTGTSPFVICVEFMVSSWEKVLTYAGRSNGGSAHSHRRTFVCKKSFSLQEGQNLAQDTYQEQLPDRIPTHNGSEIPRHQAVSDLHMRLQGHEVASDVRFKFKGHIGSRHHEQRELLVSWPQQWPTIIGILQVPIGVHRPPMPPVEAPAFQGLSTLGGGYCHEPIPELSPN